MAHKDKPQAGPTLDGPAAPFLERHAEKRQRGRPTLYDESFCDEVVEVMRAGFSLGAFAGIINVSRDTLNEWMSKHPEFSEAVKRAKMARLIHWEETGMKTASGSGGPGSATMIQFIMRNIDPEEYPDKQKTELTGADGQPIQHEVRTVRRQIVRPE